MIRGEAYNPADGVRISYEVDDNNAERPVILLIHGSGLSRASWRGLGYVRGFREAFRVVTVDLRGHGLSDKPHFADSYSRDLFLLDLIAVLDEVGAGSAHFVGYSIGARLSLEMAVTHPERITSASMLGGTPAGSAGQVARLFFPDYLEALRIGGMSAFIEGWEERAGGRVDSSTRGVFERNDPHALAAYFERVETERGIPEEVLVHVAVPTLWMAGTEDNPRYAQSQRAAEVMGGLFVPLPGRNHGTTLFPAEPVVREILAFTGALL
ncbi:alpha/beta hydrolase [Lysinibacter sp. HNR]|uniref:alpha/beta fold hydrolase n=1 Tax=Lysinibacter sp. HNR TaxID=3031408 RepID=UPI002435987A|nr:alpha/beta hydrolase [Lysinibacter sp. HNR]WGD36508.1 alpha/beta hydrolase [Lysinibacter sp. HNR]